MARQGNIPALYELASSQWGLITSAQAVALGVSRTQLNRMVDDGRLELICYGVYRSTTGAETAHVDIKAAWLSLYPKETAFDRLGKAPLDAIATGRTAAALYSYGDFHAAPYCFATSRTKRTTRPDLELLRADIDERDITRIFDIPCSTPERIVADLIRMHEDPSLISDFMMGAATNGHFFDMQRLALLLDPLSRAHGFQSGHAFACDLIDRSGVGALITTLAEKIEEALASPDTTAVLGKLSSPANANGLMSALATFAAALEYAYPSIREDDAHANLESSTYQTRNRQELCKPSRA